MSTWTVAVVAALAAAFLASSADAGEERKIAWSGTLKKVISRTVARPDDIPRHELIQMVRMDALTSPDPDFDGSTVMLYGQSDEVAGTGSFRGYGIERHKDGDELYRTYEGNIKTTARSGGAPDIMINTTKGRWVGGTGRFKNASGNYTCSGKVVPQKGPVYSCEGVIRY